MKLKERESAMSAICNEVNTLSRSPLYEYRTTNNYLPVIGEGNINADVVFIGEAPGRNEAKTGKPFCGAAGKTLDTLLQSINLERDSVYITNIVKDRPPENRDPTPQEIEVYGPFLDRQLAIIEPKVIVTLGRYAMQYIMKICGLEDQIESIGNAHGKQYFACMPYGDIRIIPQYHPAATIYNRKLIDTLAEDFKIISKFI